MGLLLGVLVTSTASGFLISRYGSYRRFPRAGTALAAVALYLLSTLEPGTPTWVAGTYMLLLGLGLVMQVLVLAAQNAVDHRLLGVATSGATCSGRSAARSAPPSSARSSRTVSAWSSRTASRPARKPRPTQPPPRSTPP